MMLATSRPGLKVTCGILLSAFLSSSASAQASFDPGSIMDGVNRRALVYLAVKGLTPGGVQGENGGTAFFIAPRGFALTAGHLFFHNKRLGQADELFTQPQIDGRIGSAGVSPVSFQLVSLYPDRDLALVKIIDPLEPVPFLPVCGAIPPYAETMYAFGFAGGVGLIAPSGRRTGDLQGNRYPVDIQINPGMSGGPIITSSGKVFAMSAAGVRTEGFQGYNFISPAQFWNEVLAQAQVFENCSSAVHSNSEIFVPSRVRERSPVVMGERTMLLDGFRDYGRSSFNFRNRKIVSWGDLTGDIGVSNEAPNPPRAPQASFFLPYNAAPYPDARGAKSEIALAPVQDLQDADDCPRAGEYEHHWFKPEVPKIYCVRIRDGSGYAKVRVIDVREDRIYFDWIFQEQ